MLTELESRLAHASKHSDVARLAQQVLDIAAEAGVRHPWAIFVLIEFDQLRLTSDLRHAIDFTQQCPLEGCRYRGETPLTASAALPNTAFLRLIIECGADFDARSLAGFTPLHVATHFSRACAWDVLVRAGADTTTLTAGGESVTQIARRVMKPTKALTSRLAAAGLLPSASLSPLEARVAELEDQVRRLTARLPVTGKRRG